MQIHRIRTPKAPLRPKREKGNVGFPTGTLTLDPPEPPSGPPDLYANLLCFGAPGPQKPRILISGSKSILPAASGRPPGDPRRLLEAPRAPPPARVAIGPRKHITSASQGGRKHVFYGPRANPGRNRTEKTRHFARPGRLFPGREADLGPKSGIWPERPRKNPPRVMVFPYRQPGPGRN